MNPRAQRRRPPGRAPRCPGRWAQQCYSREPSPADRGPRRRGASATGGAARARPQRPRPGTLSSALVVGTGLPDLLHDLASRSRASPSAGPRHRSRSSYRVDFFLPECWPPASGILALTRGGVRVSRDSDGDAEPGCTTSGHMFPARVGIPQMAEYRSDRYRIYSNVHWGAVGCAEWHTSDPVPTLGNARCPGVSPNGTTLVGARSRRCGGAGEDRPCHRLRGAVNGCPRPLGQRRRS